MNYTEAVDYIQKVPKFTTKNKPEHTVELLERLGRPDREVRVIHVAGTNGKGSVCAYLSGMLTCAGNRTGLFTSPHLVRINERFRINGKPAENDVFLAAYERVQGQIDRMVAEGWNHATYFELLYATAMVLFAREGVSYVVSETGLGGRLDATNTIEHPLATVITSVGLDHTEILGDSIEQIAREKAGILKPGVPVIYDARNAAAARVIEERAHAVGAPSFALRADQIEIEKISDVGIDFFLKCGYDERIRVSVPTPAPCQAVNSALALLAMDVIDTEHAISPALRLEAVGKTHWPGRMETVLPGVFLDGAHNADAVRELVRTIQSLGRKRRVVLLFSAVAEKDYTAMIDLLCTQALDAVVVTEVPGERRVPASVLAKEFRRRGASGIREEPDVGKAWDTALALQGDGLLFCVGSLYLVGAVKTILTARERDGADRRKSAGNMQGAFYD